MNGYTKIKLMKSSSKSKSRSMDFSDLTIPSPRIQKPKSTIIITNPDHNHDDDDYKHCSGNLHEEDGNFPMKMLTKHQTVASGGTTTDSNGTTTHSSRFKIEKQNSTGRALQTAVIRAFSVGRSSSVSERYSRIHHQYANPFDDVYHHQEQEQEEFQMAKSKKKKSRGSIVKACKRIFGL